MVDRIKHPRASVPIAIVGKYIQLPDAYLSVIESLRHAGIHHGLDIDIHWVSSEKLDAGDTSPLMGVAGILVPRGVVLPARQGQESRGALPAPHPHPFPLLFSRRT